MGTDALVVVAHQGGWDEAIFVVMPMAVLAALLWLAKRRADAEARREAGGARPEADEGEPRHRPSPGSGRPPAAAGG